MATLSDTIKPNKTYLEAVLRTALLGKTEDEYVDFFPSGLRGRLLKNPRLYRSYGPYWPEIKKLLLERGYGNFGRLVDRDVRKIYRCDRPALTLIAATLYSRSVLIMVRYTQPGIYCQCLKKLTTGTMNLSLTIWKLKPWHRLERKLEKAILHSKAWDATSITRVC